MKCLKNVFRHLATLGLFSSNGLLDLLCPPICPICGDVIEKVIDTYLPFCPACLQKMVTPTDQCCQRCGGRIPVPSGNDLSRNNTSECVRCRTASYRFTRAIVLGEYENDLRLLTLRMKTDRTSMLAVSAARVFAHIRRAELESVHADYIIPMAMHRSRRADRGVNSPDLFADELGLQLKIPVLKKSLRRIRPTNLQYTLSRRARAENVAGAFAVSPPSVWEKLTQLFIPPVRLAGKTVLLVDDILTTGSTCNEVTKVLLSAGVSAVTVTALARAEGAYRR